MEAIAIVQGYTALGIGIIIGVGLAMMFAFTNPLLGQLSGG